GGGALGRLGCIGGEVDHLARDLELLMLHLGLVAHLEQVARHRAELRPDRRANTWRHHRTERAADDRKRSLGHILEDAAQRLADGALDEAARRFHEPTQELLEFRLIRNLEQFGGKLRFLEFVETRLVGGLLFELTFERTLVRPGFVRLVLAHRTLLSCSADLLDVQPPSPPAAGAPLAGGGSPKPTLGSPPFAAAASGPGAYATPPGPNPARPPAQPASPPSGGSACGGNIAGGSPLPPG